MLKKIKTWHKKHIIAYGLSFWFAVCSLFLLNFLQAANGDLMKQAFETAKSYDTILNLWDTKDAVWNNILRESTSIDTNENLGNWCFINWQFLNVNENWCLERGWDRNVSMMNVSAQEPLIVRITKFLLRMTVVLSITMVILNSILYMIEVLNWKDRKSAEAKKNLAWVAGWIIISLMSVGIINIIISIPKSSLQTSDDMWNFEIWCKTGALIVAWDDLRQRICLNSTFWHNIESMQYREWNPTRILNRCYICESGNNGCDRKAITNWEMRSKCVEDMFWETIE